MGCREAASIVLVLGVMLFVLGVHSSDQQELPTYSLVSGVEAQAVEDEEETLKEVNNINNSDRNNTSYGSKCAVTKWEGFTSGLLCQGGINGRCVYRVPIGRALTLGANTFLVSFANGHSATRYKTGSSPSSTSGEDEGSESHQEPEPIPHRHSTTLSESHSTYSYQSDAHLGPLDRTIRPIFFRLLYHARRVYRTIRGRLDNNNSQQDEDLGVIQNDPSTIGRFRRLDNLPSSTALALRADDSDLNGDEEAEGGRREHSVRLLLDQGVIEVEDLTQGWRTAGATKPDLCRCDHCACILGLTVRGLRC